MNCLLNRYILLLYDQGNLLLKNIIVPNWLYQLNIGSYSISYLNYNRHFVNTWILIIINWKYLLYLLEGFTTGVLIISYKPICFCFLHAILVFSEFIAS